MHELRDFDDGRRELDDVHRFRPVAIDVLSLPDRRSEWWRQLDILERRDSKNDEVTDAVIPSVARNLVVRVGRLLCPALQVPRYARDDTASGHALDLLSVVAGLVPLVL